MLNMFCSFARLQYRQVAKEFQVFYICFCFIQVSKIRFFQIVFNKSWFFLDGCGSRSRLSIDGFSIDGNNNPETIWASGYQGLIFYATINDESTTKSYNWKISFDEKYEEFYFKSDFSNSLTKWVWEDKTKITMLFEVQNLVLEKKIYSYFRTVKKPAENTTLELEFSVENHSFSTKNCSISNITFKSKLLVLIH